MLLKDVKAIADDAGVPCGISDDSAFTSTDHLDGFEIEIGGNGQFHHSGKPAFVNFCSIRANGDGCRVYIDDGAYLERVRLFVDGKDSAIYIGRNVRIKNATITVTGNSCATIIGSRTSWESGKILCSRADTHVIIGEDCMLSNAITIRTDLGHGIFDRTTHQSVNQPETVILEPHVWLGNGVRLEPGIRVGTGSVLGTVSVLTSDMDPHSIYAGIPARKVKENIAWSRSGKFDDIPEEYLDNPRNEKKKRKNVLKKIFGNIFKNSHSAG